MSSEEGRMPADFSTYSHWLANRSPGVAPLEYAAWTSAHLELESIPWKIERLRARRDEIKKLLGEA